MTLNQTKAFWRAFSNSCDSQKITDRADRESYRKQIMREELGAEHISQIDERGGFERIMARIWSDAGQYEIAGSYMVGDARRLGYLVCDCCEQVACLSRNEEPDVDAYVCGILRQAGICVRPLYGDEWVLEVPERSTRAVFQILDTHRRRLLRRGGYRGRMRYHCGMRWRYDDDGQIIPIPPGDAKVINRYHQAG